MRQELDAQEKCVDIALAVEMLSLAHVPGAYDIAVLVSGDKDFMPALDKVRQQGKRTAICSMRNSCNKDLSSIDANIRDFEMIWLDENLDAFMEKKPEDVIPAVRNDNNLRRATVRTIAKQLVQAGPEGVRSRPLGRTLGGVDIDGFPGLTVQAYLKQNTNGLLQFMSRFPLVFSVGSVEVSPEFEANGFLVQLHPGFDPAIYENDEEDGGQEEDELDTILDLNNSNSNNNDDIDDDDDAPVIDYNYEKTQNRERYIGLPKTVASSSSPAVKIVNKPLTVEDVAHVQEDFIEEGEMLIAKHRMDDEKAVMQVIVKTIAQVCNTRSFISLCLTNFITACHDCNSWLVLMVGQ